MSDPRPVDEFQVIAAKDGSIHVYLGVPEDLRDAIAAASCCAWEIADRDLVVAWGDATPLLCSGLTAADAASVRSTRVLFIGALCDTADLVNAFRFEKNG